MSSHLTFHRTKKLHERMSCSKKRSIPPQKLTSKDGDGVVKPDEKRQILGDKPPADGNDADRPRRDDGGKEEDESALGDARATRRRTEVEEHIEKDHTPHDGVPIGIRNAEPQQEARHDGVDAQEVQPRLDEYHEHLARCVEQEGNCAFRIAIEGKELASPMVAQAARDPHDEIVQIAAPCADDNEDDADKRGEGNHHEYII